MIPKIPSHPGSYVMVGNILRPLTLNVGVLGINEIPAGNYFYAGSARRIGGLKSRITHHLRVNVNPLWHIDYLRSTL